MSELKKHKNPSTVVGLLLVAASVLVVTFGSGSHFGGGAHITNMTSEPPVALLAARAHQLRVAPKITEEMLQETLAAVRANAANGDVEAAAFMFELAATQNKTADSAGGDE